MPVPTSVTDAADVVNADVVAVAVATAGGGSVLLNAQARSFFENQAHRDIPPLETRFPGADLAGQGFETFFSVFLLNSLAAVSITIVFYVRSNGTNGLVEIRWRLCSVC